MTDLKTIAEELCAGCREGRETENLEKLYAQNAISVEAFADPQTGESTKTGIDEIKGKHEWWEQNFEAHSLEVSGPHLHGEDRFGVIFRMDVTEKNSGQRMQMEEVGIYTVADGKIAKEEFFYAPMG